MAKDFRDLALQRLERFRQECKERDMPSLSNNENVRLKSFFMKELIETYGEKISEIPFDDLLPEFMGSGIVSIEKYIQSNAIDFTPMGDDEFLRENPDETRDEVSPDNDRPKQIEEVTPPPTSPDSDTRQGRRAARRNPISSDIIWTPPTSAKGNTRRIKDLKNQIATLEKDRDLLHRQFTLYRQDYAILQGIIEFGKKGNTPLIFNGLSLDNQQNVIHAALECLINELHSSNMTECFQNIKKYRDDAQDETDRFNQKITKLQKELQKITGQ